MAMSRYGGVTGSKHVNEDFENINVAFNNVAAENDGIKSDINSNKQDLGAHKNSTSAHAAQNITYSGEAVGENVKAAIDYTNDRIDNLIITGGDSSPEVADARGGYPVLGDRLNASDAQLAEMAKGDISFFNVPIQPPFSLRTINAFGDSITHGANAPDMVNDSWAGIMRKFLQLEYNTRNYGFVPMRGEISNGYGVYKDVHKLVLTNALSWTFVENGDTIGNESLHAPNDDSRGVDLEMSKPSKYFRIIYQQTPEMGSFNVYVDGELRGTVNTSGVLDYNHMSDQILGNESAPFKITILKVGTSKLMLNGVFYYSNNAEVIFNRYGRSGVTLSQINNSTLDSYCNASVVFFALGNTDWFQNLLSSFNSKIDYLISKLQYGQKVIVLDFLWFEQIDNNDFKKAIKRLADNTNSIYIDFNIILKNQTELVLQQRGFLSDSVHPTPLGHNLIAEVIAKKIGLGVSSKSLAERLLTV